ACAGSLPPPADRPRRCRRAPPAARRNRATEHSESAVLLRVGHDPGQRLAQLVGQRGGQLPHGGNTGEVRQLLPAPLRLPFRTLAFGDLGLRNHGAAFGSIQRHDGYREPSVFTWTGAETFERKSLSCSFEHLLDSREHIRRVRRALATDLATRLDEVSSHL